MSVESSSLQIFIDLFNKLLQESMFCKFDLFFQSLHCQLKSNIQHFNDLFNFRFCHTKTRWRCLCKYIIWYGYIIQIMMILYCAQRHLNENSISTMSNFTSVMRENVRYKNDSCGFLFRLQKLFGRCMQWNIWSNSFSLLYE